jgi:glycosyltransferase involved in cell wall biosynthesis/peptidoglycan/xylan/chitin deacetylase (PgdA/CDA1 family)
MNSKITVTSAQTTRPGQAPGGSLPPVVLAYHEITNTRSLNLYSLSCTQFRDHLRILKDLASEGRREGALTFDDGHASHYTYALPLLEEFGLRGAFCVAAGWTGRDPNYMSAGQLRELHALGHEIQAHGWSHKMLTQCSPARLYEELYLSKCLLEDLLGAPVEGMSIPHGRWNSRVLEVCAAVGYKHVYTSDAGLESLERSGVLLTGRLMVTGEMTPQALSRILRSERPFKHQYRLRGVLKRAAKAAVGEKYYHRLWRFLAARKGGPSDPDLPDRPTRILQLISSQGYYGAECMLVNLAKSLESANCQCVVGVVRNSQNPHVEVAERAKAIGLRTEIISCEGRLHWKAVRAIQSIIYRYGIDIVHTHGCKADVYGRLAAASLHVPLVATYHIDWPDRSLALHCYHLLDRLNLHRFQRVIAVSDAIERSLRRTGLPGRKTGVIANGIDVSPFVSAQENKARKDLVIGVVGRLTPQKGHRYLLQAAPAIRQEFPNATFVFFGDGPEKDRLQQIALSLELDNSVVFAGQRSDMPAVYASIDLLVLPSVNEGMPMTLIEGLAARRPVVATRVGDVPKVIRHNETGLLVEPGNPEALKAAIITLLSDPAKAEALAAAGQRWACENYSAGAMAVRYRRVYDEVLGKSERPGSPS